MNDQEKIAALAAELTRIGRIPKSVFKVHGKPHFAIMNKADKWMRCDEAVLAALSGIAAEVCAANGLCFVKSGDEGEWDEEGEKIVYTSWVWELFDHGWENGSTLIEQYATYHEALIAALKQIEVNP